MYSKEQVQVYKNKYIRCKESNNDYFEKDKFYRIKNVYQFSKNMIFVYVEKHDNIDGYKTFPFVIKLFSIYFKLKSKEEYRKEKIDKLLNE